MSVAERVREARALGETVDSISERLGISQQWAYKCARGVDRDTRDTAGTVVRMHAHNGGCSTQSGMVPIRMPRIVALHGQVAA